jgi:hypothetical protein
MNNLPNFQNATFESVWASLQETDRILTEKFAETERLRKEADAKFEKSREDFDRRMKKLQEQIGGWAENQGEFAEEYFFNSFEQGQMSFFGEQFDEIEKNLKPKKKNNIQDEYDIVMSNGSSVAIVETKYKAHKKDIERVINKANTFRILCPDYKNFKIYLGLASLSFYPELEQECIAQGIAVIKQVGETVIINDKELKVF